MVKGLRCAVLASVFLFAAIAAIAGIPPSGQVCAADAPVATPSPPDIASPADRLSDLRQARSNEIAAYALAAAEEYPQRSALLALEALLITQRNEDPPTYKAQEALRTALNSLSGAPIRSNFGAVTAFAVGPDSRRVFMGAKIGWIEAASLDGGEPLRPRPAIDIFDLPVKHLLLSPDARWLAAASELGETQIIDVSSPDFEAYSLSLPPDATVDRFVFTGDSNGLITLADSVAQIWDLRPLSRGSSATGASFPTAPDEIVDMTASPDGHRLFIAGGKGELEVRDISSIASLAASTRLRGLGRPPRAIALSRNARIAAVLTSAGEAQVWLQSEASPDQKPQTIDASGEGARSIRVDADGRYLAIWGEHAIRMVDLSAIAVSGSRDTQTTYPIYAAPVDWAISPDARWLAIAFAEGVELWDLTSQNEALGEGFPRPVWLAPFESELTTLAFSPDSARLIVASGELGTYNNTMSYPENFDDGVRVWNLSSFQPRAAGIVIDDLQSPVALSPDGGAIVFARSDGRLRLANLADPAQSSVVANPGRPLEQLFYSRDGRWLAGLAGGEALVWRVGQRDLTPASIKATGEVEALAFSANSRWLISFENGATTRIWSLSSAESAGNQLQPSISVDATPALASDGRRLVLQHPNGQVELWDLELAEPAERARKLTDMPPDSLRAADVSADGAWLSSVSNMTDDPTLRVQAWFLNATPISARDVISDGWAFPSAGFSPNGRWFVALDHQLEGQLWNLRASPPTIRQIERDWSDEFAWSNESGEAFGLFSPDSRWLATGGWRSSVIQLRNLTASGSLDAPIALRRLRGGTVAVTYSADGSKLAAQPMVGPIRVWDLSAPDPRKTSIAFLEVGGQIAKLTFTPDGRWLACEAGDQLWLWPMDIDALMRKACEVVGRDLSELEWDLFFPAEKRRSTCSEVDAH